MNSTSRPTLRSGTRGPDVARLQDLLNSRLLPSPHLRADGTFGPRTEQAVRQFQQQCHQLTDGVVGPKTWTLLEGGQSNRPREVEPRWLQLARREIGVAEIPGRQHNPRIVAYHATTTLRATNDETAWCSSFVNWCLNNAGITGTNSAAAASWMGWGIHSTARLGAITVIFNAAAARSSLSHSGNHVGFLIEETSSHYKILGGNQNDRVKESSFGKGTWQLKGYRWPIGG